MVRAIGTYTITEVYDGRGLSYVNYFYKATSNQTQPAASSITDTSIPSLNSTNKYLWQKQVQYYNSLLPQAYTQLDYIETTGNSWIDTGISPNTNTQWELKFRAINSSTPFYGSFTTNQRFRIDNNSAGLGTKWKNFPGTGGAPVVGDDYIVIWDSKRLSISINGDESILNTTAFTNDINIYLFAQNNNAEGTNRSTGASRLYYSKLTQDNELVRNFIPCKRNSDNVLGVYDTVDGVFYTNQGTGTFTAGPVSEQDYDEVITLIAVCGDDGTNAIQSFLSNESHTLPADSSGTPTTYAGAETYMYVYEGSQDVTSQYNFSRNASSGITSSISGNKVTVTGVSNGTGGTITITATKGSTTLTKVFNISISKAGTNGTSVTITTKNVTYQLGDSGTTAPTGSWLVSVPNLEPTKYLWTKTYVKYSDNTENISYSVSYIARDGTNGQTGPAGRGIVSTTVEYQKSASGTTVPTGTWQATIGDVGTIGPGEYLWTRTTTSYTSGNDSVGYSVGMMGATGAIGPSGTGTKYFGTRSWTQSQIDSMQIGYSSTWSNNLSIATITGDTLILDVTNTTNNSKLTYTLLVTSGAPASSSPTAKVVSIIRDGSGIDSITEEYYLSTSKTTQSGGSWVTTPPAWVSGKYIWTRSKIVYKNPASTVYTTPVCSSEWEAANAVQAGIDDKENNFNYKYHLDVTLYGDANTFYPVIIKSGNQDVKRTIMVRRSYGELAPDDWYEALSQSPNNVHRGALTLKILCNFGGWGGTTYSWEIAEFQENYSVQFGGAQNANTQTAFCIFLRGGGETGARYHLYSDQRLDNAGSYHYGWDEDLQKYKANVLKSPQIAYDSDLYFGSPGNKPQNPAGSGYYDDMQYKYYAPAPRPMVNDGTTVPSGGPHYVRNSSQNEEIRIRQYVKLAQDTDKKVVKSTTTEYYLSTSSSTTTGSSWVASMPARVDNKYIWTRQKIVYSDGTSITSAATCVDNISGGRNLLVGTANVTGDVASGSGTLVSNLDLFGGLKGVKTNAAWSERCINLKRVYNRNGFRIGDTLTASVYVKADSATTQNFNIYRAFNGSSTAKSIALTTNWQQIYFTFIADSYSTTVENTRIECQSATGDNYIYWAGWKLEKGNVPSDWTPAPEDVDTQFNDMTTYINGIRDDLQGQIDGAIQFWNGPDVPTLNNYPANQWTTEDERTAHQADIYTVIIDQSGELKQGKGYRFDKVNGNWVWVEITDQEMSAVQALAASKAKVFVTTPTVPYSVGDLWLKDGELWKCKTAKDTSGSYALSDWEVATDYTDDSTANQVQANLDNLVIGGTNLALRTKDITVSSKYWAYGSGWTKTVDDDGFTVLSFSRSGSTGANWVRAIPHAYFTKQDLDDKGANGVIVSFDLKIDSIADFNSIAGETKGCLVAIQSWAENGTRVGWYEAQSIVSPNSTYSKKITDLQDGVWARVSVKFTYYNMLPVSASGYTRDDISYSNISFQLTRDGSIHIKKIKIEYGDKATDWSPAPEDSPKTLDVEYYLSTSATSTTGGSWQTTAPAWVDGKYMWSRQKLTYVDGTEEYKNETCIAGAKGEDARKYVTLVTNDNLNDKRAKDTVYVTTSTAVCNSLQNKPTGFIAGECRVEIEWLGADTYLVQRLYCKAGTSSKIFHRTYYNGTWGSWLEDTSRTVNISPSAQVFKSTTGDVGPFEPQYIYIYPSFIGCTYSKWQYSTNGGSSWNDVTSGSNSLTIGTYNSIANTLRVERNSSLYTSSVTALSFKCVSNFSDAYDTTTIIKVYDVTELQVGGRNFFLNSDSFTRPGAADTGTGSTSNTIHPSIENGLWKIVVDTPDNSNWLSWAHENIIEENFNTGDAFTFSFEIKSDDATSTTPPDIYFKNGLGYYRMKGSVSSEWSRVYYTGTWKDTNAISLHLGWSGYNRQGTYYIRRLKFESGQVATAWTPAIEDIYNDKPVIEGTQTTDTYNWTGVAPFNKLEDGQKITYWLPRSCGGSQVTMPYWKDAAGTTQQSTNNGAALNLTLSDGTTTGNIACYYNGTSRLTSHWGAGNSIESTYKKLIKIGSYWYTGWWANANYNTDNLDNKINYFAGKTGAKGIWQTSLFMEDANGTYQNICTASDGTVTTSNRTNATTKIANTNGFKVGSSIYYAATSYNANTNISGWQAAWSSQGSLFDSRYAFNTSLVAGSLTAYKPLYLVGTIHSDGLFYLDTTWWSQTPTTNGKIYILVGACYDSTTSNCRITLYENNRWYICKNSQLYDFNNSMIDEALALAQQAVDDSVIRSATEPQDPVEGMLWFDTTNDILYLYTSNQWRSQDMSLYASATDVETLKVNRNRTWIAQPVPPYNAGDTWVVQSGADKGKIKTCIQSRTSGSYSAGDWINPIDAYTTNTELTNVLGTDPKEWSSSSKSITTLINENTGEIEGQRKQISSLAVRASGIEMSFSRTGTMNFLGNSSGQNGMKGWTIPNTMINNIGAISASAASDVRQSLVSLSAFKMTFTSSLKSLTMTSALFTPPTSDVFTVSAKFKIPGKYVYVTFTINLYSDPDGQTLLGSRVMNVPYAVGAEDLFLLYHMSINKSDFTSVPQSARIVINGIQDTSDSVCLTTNPANDKGKIASAGKLYKYSSTYTYLKPVYKKITVDEFDHYLTASNLVGDKVYLCTKDMDKDSLSDNDYVRGVYYTIAENAIASSKKLKPINDSYTIMLLDSSREDPNDNSKAYYNITMNGTNENLETSSTNFTIGQYTTIYVGDIMVNGGNNVQTWTPRQDENLWGENIKFDYSGITIENIPSGYKRIIDSNSDIAYQINDSGDIVKCIWKLTQDGFITNDIKCIGTFAMGYVTNEASSDLENTFTAVMEMKKNTNRDGVDEYLYVNS